MACMEHSAVVMVMPAGSDVSTASSWLVAVACLPIICLSDRLSSSRVYGSLLSRLPRPWLSGGVISLSSACVSYCWWQAASQAWHPIDRETPGGWPLICSLFMVITSLWRKQTPPYKLFMGVIERAHSLDFLSVAVRQWNPHDAGQTSWLQHASLCLLGPPGAWPPASRQPPLRSLH